MTAKRRRLVTWGSLALALALAAIAWRAWGVDDTDEVPEHWRGWWNP